MGPFGFRSQLREPHSVAPDASAPITYTTNVAYSASARTSKLTFSAPNPTLPVGRYDAVDVDQEGRQDAALAGRSDIEWLPVRSGLDITE